MKGEEKEEGKKAAFGSTLLTSVLIIIAAVAFFFIINSFRHGGEDGGFEGLVSQADGTILVQRDGDLGIDAITFRDFEGRETSVNFLDNPGHKIKSVVLRERIKGVKEFDMRRTLAANSIELTELVAVPQEVSIRVTDGSGRGSVVLYILTDKPYKAPPTPRAPGIESNQLKFQGQVGRKGVWPFFIIEKDGIYPRSEEGGSLGEGPIALLMAVRTVAGRPVGRSQMIIVMRKGIVHPDDIWLNEYKSGYFSQPFMGDSLESSRVAFYTATSNDRYNLVISMLDYKYPFDVSALFPEGPMVIDHWGRSDDDFDILYVKIAGDSDEVYRVKVGHAELLRLTGGPEESGKQEQEKEKEPGKPVEPEKPPESGEPAGHGDEQGERQ